MTVSAKVRKSLPASRLGEPESGGYPMQDRKHAALAKAFAAMHHAKNKAEIDAKADKILARKKGGRIGRQMGGKIPAGVGVKASNGRPGRQMGGQLGAPQMPPPQILRPQPAPQTPQAAPPMGAPPMFRPPAPPPGVPQPGPQPQQPQMNPRVAPGMAGPVGQQSPYSGIA
jgi:hypothetical protein